MPSSTLIEAIRNPDTAQGLADISRLLSEGANPNAKDAQGKTALHWAVQIRGHETHIELLLDAGANIDARDRSGQTPLLLATRYNLEAEKLLIDRGANVEKKDRRGDTPIARIVKPEQTEEISFADRQRLLRMADKNPQALDRQDKKGQTLLHKLADKPRVDSVNRLLMAGANANVQDVNGETPAHIAARAGNGNVISRLREGNASEIPLGSNEVLPGAADLNIQNKKDGYTPQHIAREEGFLTLARGLEARNPNPPLTKEQATHKLYQELIEDREPSPPAKVRTKPQQMFPPVRPERAPSPASELPLTPRTPRPPATARSPLNTASPATPRAVVGAAPNTPSPTLSPRAGPSPLPPLSSTSRTSSIDSIVPRSPSPPTFDQIKPTPPAGPKVGGGRTR